MLVLEGVGIEVGVVEVEVGFVLEVGSDGF